MATLDELESRLQSLLEVQLLKLLPGYKVEDGIAQRLAAAMHANLKEIGGITQAPNLYVIVAHPSTLTRWHTEPRLLLEMANALSIAGKEAGFQFSVQPLVTTTYDISMPPAQLRIIASFSSESVAETQAVVQASPEKVPSNAFLIIAGKQLVPLDRSVVNIGRRLDNHVVIDDARVSRAHAQLRILKDSFVIFDLNSSGGTFVNGQRTNQSILHPGDVISLAGVSIIFGQDLPQAGNPAEGLTEPGVPASIAPSPSSHEEENGPIIK